MEQIEKDKADLVLQIPDYFTETEVDVLYAELPKTVERDSPRIIFEDNGSIRSIFAPHFVNETYERLSRHKKLVIPSEQLIGDKIYLHQYKVHLTITRTKISIGRLPPRNYPKKSPHQR